MWVHMSVGACELEKNYDIELTSLASSSVYVCLSISVCLCARTCVYICLCVCPCMRPCECVLAQSYFTFFPLPSFCNQAHIHEPKKGNYQNNFIVRLCQKQWMSCCPWFIYRWVVEPVSNISVDKNTSKLCSLPHSEVWSTA